MTQNSPTKVSQIDWLTVARTEFELILDKEGIKLNQMLCENENLLKMNIISSGH